MFWRTHKEASSRRRIRPARSVDSSQQVLDKSVFFSPNLSRKAIINEEEISNFQNSYIEGVSSLNDEHSRKFTRLRFEDANEISEFRMLFDDLNFHSKNVLKVCLVLFFVVFLTVSIFLPFNNPSVTIAIDQYQKKDDVLNTVIFGSTEDVMVSNRENPSFAQNVTLTVRGESRTFTTTEFRVSDILRSQSIVLGYNEAVYPTSEAIVGDDEQIVVDQKVLSTETTADEVPFEQVRIDDVNLRKGEEVLQQDGKTGKSINTYVIQQVGGNVISKELMQTQVLSAPLSRIVRVGTLNPTDNGTMVTVPADEVKKFALEQVRAMWGNDSEFTCLDKLWQKESGWRTNAGNVISGAYGIPQALPGSKMASAGADWRDNPLTQVKWGIGYIKGRYGTPCSAWANSQAHNWY